MSDRWRVTIQPGQDVRERLEAMAVTLGVPVSTFFRIVLRQVAAQGCQWHPMASPGMPMASPGHPPGAGAPGMPMDAPGHPQGIPRDANGIPGAHSTSTSTSTLSPYRRERESTPESTSTTAPEGGGSRENLTQDQRVRLAEVQASGELGGRPLTETQRGILETVLRHGRAIGRQRAFVARVLEAKPEPAKPKPPTGPPKTEAEREAYFLALDPDDPSLSPAMRTVARTYHEKRQNEAERAEAAAYHMTLTQYREASQAEREAWRDMVEQTAGGPV